jgi:hypothetical protein
VKFRVARYEGARNSQPLNFRVLRLGREALVRAAASSWSGSLGFCDKSRCVSPGFWLNNNPRAVSACQGKQTQEQAEFRKGSVLYKRVVLHLLMAI